MTIKNALQRRRVKWLLWFGFWTLIGLSFAFQFYISSAKAGLEVTWRQAVSYALGDWYVFAVLSIPVVWLARRGEFLRAIRRAERRGDVDLQPFLFGNRVQISGGLSGIPAGSKACASVVRRRCRRHLPCLPCHSAMLETR